MIRDLLSFKTVTSLFNMASKCLTAYLAIFAAANMNTASATAYSNGEQPYRLKSGLTCDGNPVNIPPYAEYSFNIPFTLDDDNNCTTSSAQFELLTEYKGDGGIFMLADVRDATSNNDYTNDCISDFSGFLTKDAPIKLCAKKDKCADWEPSFWVRTERCSATKDGKTCSDAIQHDAPIVIATCTVVNK